MRNQFLFLYLCIYFSILLYYTLEDYIFYKEIFDTTFGTEVNTDDIKIFLSPKYRSIESAIRNRFIDGCKRIKLYFEYFKKKDSCNNSECCNFINYWINKKFRELISNDFNTKWYLFRYFLEYVHYNNNDDKYNRCIHDIKYMDNDLFNKVNKLYNCYEFYDGLIYSIEINIEKETLCGYFNNLIKEYNEIIQDYNVKDDTILVKELNNIRCLIENVDWKSTDDCMDELPRLSNNYDSNDYDDTCKSLKEEGYIQRYSRRFVVDFLPPSPDTNTSIIAIIRTLFISIIVGVIVLGLYKFRLFRMYLYPIILRMRKMLTNTYDESYEQHISEYDNNTMDLEEKKYNIIYISGSKY
ncbi:variable surface protein [Plasmodium gonderi]|uniref:Variable surface protein n=1 Tax=Plasmodium gonderi TaxID=77519 RepID=A0A1Y1JSS6_PLAGO|nr:variable surface protein [Plasmodium gonderi]GAW84207.1 variable surface protein [Plasmodium gonderi]